MSDMGGTEVIKSFLVGLGFGVDDASLAKFNKSIAGATLKVTALYAATKVAAAGIVAGIAKVSEGFEQMGYEYHIIAPAINKALLLRKELLKSYALAGINIRKVVKDSINLNLSLTKTKFAFEAIYKSVASKFFERLTKQSDLFRAKIYANMPKIQRALESFVNVVFRALDITNILGARLWSILGRVWDFLVKLDTVTGGWSTRILAVVAAWKFLNLSFLATPLGMIIAGLVAILALFDDFMTWKDGGESLFNWAPFVPVIDAVTQAIEDLLVVVKSLFDLGNGGFLQDPVTGFKRLLGVVGDVLVALSEVGAWMAKITGLGGALNSVVNFLSGTNVQPNVAAATAPGASAPLGSNSNTSNNTNQHVTQQTTVHVQGVPDANGVGNAVSGVMAKNNFDLVRNLQGSVRSGGQVK